MALLQVLFGLSTFDAMLRIATPLILCAMAGIFSERSGIVDISLEGKLLIGAFVAAAVGALSGSLLLALLSAILASCAMSLIHGFATITHRGDQVVSGVAMNILASGLTVILGIALFQQGGQTPILSNDDRFLPITLPLADLLGAIPLIGPIYSKVISGHNALVYFAFFCVFITYFALYRTRFGLRLRAVGEMPHAVDTAGISVSWLRYRALFLGGIFCGVAGAYLSIAAGSNFVREMSAGKGYIALAAVIFGNWRPIAALYACLLFGYLEAVAPRLQNLQFPLIGEIPSEIISATPYVMTVLLLAGFIGRSTPPAAIGKPYIK